MKTLVRRLFGFGVLPILAAVAPLALLPVIARTGGVSGWASYTVALSVGNLASTLIGFGSVVGGAAEVARAESHLDRVALYFRSTQARSLLIPPSVAFGGVAVLLLTPRSEWIVSLPVFLATAFAGMSISWWTVGAGRPMDLARFEVLPRLVATLLSLAIILGFKAIWPYGVLLLLSMFAGRYLFRRKLKKVEGVGHRLSLSQCGLELRRRLHYLSIDVVNNAYNSLVLPFASLGTSTASTAIVASADRFYRYTLIPLSALGDGFQAWNHEAPGLLNRRRDLATLVHLFVAMLGVVTIGIAGPDLTRLLFGSAVAATPFVCWAYGGTFAASTMLAPLCRFYILPSGETRTLSIWTLIGSGIGISVMSVGAVTSSLTVLASSLTISHFVILLGIAPSVARVRRAAATTAA